MANWKNKDEYPSIKGTSLDRWAAEFLYRNPIFLSEYNAAKNEEIRLGSSRLPIGWNERPTGKVLVKYGVSLPNIWGDSIHDSPVFFTKYPMWVGRKDLEKIDGKSYFITPFDESLSVIAFDLSQPINPQLDRAKKMLISSQGNFEGKKQVVRKAIVKLYPFYLRVLDAFKDGVHPHKISEVLSFEYSRGVSDDTLRNWKLKAEQLRDGGYLDIVTSSEP